MSNDLASHMDPLTRGSGSEPATFAAPTTAVLHPTADLPRPSSPPTTSRLPDAFSPPKGIPNHVARRLVVLANDRQSQTQSHESAETTSRISPTQVPYRPSLFSSDNTLHLTEVKLSKEYGQLPWFDGPDYQDLYQELKHQTFDGYTCIEKDMTRAVYRIPEKSIRCVSKQLDGILPRAASTTGTDLDSEYYVGFSKSELLDVSRRPEGLTLGGAIQKLYMSRLHESNRLLPMTKVYEGGGRTGEGPGKQQSPGTAGTVWLGDVVDSVNLELLSSRNITAMVSIHPRDFRSRGQEIHGSNGTAGASSPIRWHLRLQLADSKEADLESKFESVFGFIQRHVDEGHNVLVHCIAGLSRSVTVVRDFIQRIEVKEGRVTMTGTATERYLRMTKSRDATFQRLKMMRPGITDDNFKDQLDNSTMKICGLPRKTRAAAGVKQESKEHGGGGYIGDAVALVFFFYRLRPTPKVIQLFEKRRIDHARKEEELGANRNGFSFPAPLIEWFEDCIHKCQDSSSTT